MNQIWESFASVCVVLAATEAAGRICSKNAMVNFVRALVLLVLLTSILSGLFSLDFDRFRPLESGDRAGEELSGSVEDRLERAAEEDLEAWLQGLLQTVGLKAEKILLETDIGADGSIVLTKVSALFTYEADAQRAAALLKNTLGDEVEVEVETDGR